MNRFSKDVLDFLSEHGNLKPNQYIDDILVVTLEQWYLALEQEPFKINPFPLMFISVVKDDKIMTLPSGRVLVYSKSLDSFTVFDEDVARQVGMIR